MNPLRAAIDNNVRWCDAVCRAHGLAPDRRARVWSCPTRTPAHYPDAITITEDVTVRQVLSTIDTSHPGASVKDSFACLDLAPDGFTELFRARWIVRDGGGLDDVEPLSRVDDPTRWGLPVSLAGHPSIAFLDGAIANYGPDGIVGLSNVAGEDAWRPAVAAVARLWPGARIVGYEHGDDLGAAQRVGFTPIGDLIVWVA